MNRGSGESSKIQEMEKFKLAKLVEKPTIDERWYVEYNYRNPETGKFKSPAFRIFISSKIKTKAGRRKKGYDIVNEINRKLREGFNPYQLHEVRFTPIYEAIFFALQVKRALLRERSYHTYKNIITTFQRFLQEKSYSGIPSEDFNSLKAQEFMDWAKITLRITNRTYNNYVKCMRTFFYTLEQREFISFNPFKKIDMVQVEEPEIIMFSKEELTVIKQTLPEYDPGLFLCSQLIFYCALRPTEICRLRISNIDLINKVIHLSGSISKNKKSEKVIIPDQLQEILLNYNLERYPKHFYLISKGLRPGIYEIAHTRISERWRKYADDVELDPRKTIYLLKHTVAGLLVKAGKDIRSIQLHFRHSNLEMTKIYLDKIANMPDSDMRDGYVDF